MDAYELPDDEFPVVLNTGRLQHQWHTMTKTGKVDKLNKLTGGPFVEVHPDDAAALGITDGGRAEVTSRRGRVVLPAVVTDRVRPGNCFAPFHWNDEQGEDLTINTLTSDAVDPMSLQPEFKVCAVRLAAVASDTVPGLPESAPALEDDEKLYLAGFFTGLEGGLAGVPTLPEAAPLCSSVRLWVDGWLAGRYSRAEAGAVTASSELGGPVVLWASQTGNAEVFATQVAARLGGARLLPMSDATVDDLVGPSDVVIITSTFGDGGPPDNGANFWDALEAQDPGALDGVRYAVLGIGDRSYDEFCGYAKSLDRKLSELGASRLIDRAECEAYDDEPIAAWADRIVDLIGGEDRRDLHDGRDPAGAATVAQKSANEFTRTSPIRVPLSRNVLLTPRTAAKEVRQFGFDVSEHGVNYAVGDALGVYVTNAPAVVDAWLAAVGLSGTEPVLVDGAEVGIREALGSSYDVCRVTPNLIGFLSERSADAAKLLKTKSDRERWLVGRNGIDLVEEFGVRAAPEEWQDALVRLVPRSYSISSSPLVSPHEVQLTVSVLRYRSARGGDRGGVSSTFLADRASHAEVFLQPSPHFRPPEDGATPMIMIGPGTGIAPFRGFLQERRALGHRGPNWLFFGDRHRAENFYYREDLEDMARDGLLNRLDLAFSRDQADRVYVQHKMLDYGADVWRWLEDGAHFYVCGDATRMAKDVDDALTTIIRTHGGMSHEGAHDYKRELVATKRYVRDVY